MKRIIAVFLGIIMCISLCACGNSESKEAFQLSQSAFNNIHNAYEKIDSIGNDITKAWLIGINSQSKLEEWREGFDFFCENVSLSRDEVLDGLAYLQYLSEKNEYPSSNYEIDKELVREYYDLYFSDADGYLLDRYDNTFSACIDLVIAAYTQKGEFAEIEQLLLSAEEAIKELSENYSDYEHYGSVKEYFTTANTYFNFCKTPKGTLDQTMENINEYNNTADKCYNSLYYFFE